jgi:xylulokinase
MKTVVLGVDSSTQSCTIVARRADDGAIVGTAHAAHPPTKPPVSEQDPRVWWDALRESLHSVGKMEVGAISIDGQGHGMVLLDSRNEIVRPAKLWNDTESRAESVELIETLGPAKWVKKTCIVPVPAFTICKLLWVFRHEPGVRDRLRRILLPHDWISFRLTGHLYTDRSEASGTGYFSPATSTWQPELLRLVDPDVKWELMLPDIAGPDDIVGRVTPEAAASTGLPAGIPVGPGCNDNSASALGLGLRQSDVCISVGTSGTVFAPSATPVFDTTGAVDGNADATGRFLPLVCTLNATKVTDWAMRVLGVDQDRLAQMGLAAPASSGRPILVPFFDGERTPNLPLASGIIVGLRNDTTAEQLARACYEGVLLGLASGVEALMAAGVDVSGRVILTGGGAASPAYVQLLADILDRPVHIATETKSAALGAAVQAAAAFHGVSVSEIQQRWAPKLMTAADPRRDQACDELRSRYQQLVNEEEVKFASSKAG